MRLFPRAKYHIWTGPNLVPGRFLQEGRKNPEAIGRIYGSLDPPSQFGSKRARANVELNQEFSLKRHAVMENIHFAAAPAPAATAPAPAATAPAPAAATPAPAAATPAPAAAPTPAATTPVPAAVMAAVARLSLKSRREENVKIVNGRSGEGASLDLRTAPNPPSSPVIQMTEDMFVSTET
ncbi:uncharacterized protein LOC143354999 [Halictus rubicundus]|uniref:uncharacterized protein LOC143354999 n=1 Tax=Halictus rubicundus TaxID=77578 RepID=UPI004036D8A8